MSGQTSRRRASAIFALMPALALGLPLVSASARARVIPPSGPIRLRRVLTRGLADGKAIVVTRVWSIAVTPSGGGYIVSGEQLSAEVTAPPVLSAIADLERRRDISGFLPIQLDAAGLIVPTGKPADTGTVERGIDTARTLLASISAEDQREAASFLASLAKSGATAMSQLPRDLFFPAPGTDGVSRDYPLPGGESGSLAITTTARAAPETGFLLRCERTIVTQIGADRRVSSEVWEALPGN